MTDVASPSRLGSSPHGRNSRSPLHEATSRRPPTRAEPAAGRRAAPGRGRGCRARPPATAPAGRAPPARRGPRGPGARACPPRRGRRDRRSGSAPPGDHGDPAAVGPREAHEGGAVGPGRRAEVDRQRRGDDLSVAPSTSHARARTARCSPGHATAQRREPVGGGRVADERPGLLLGPAQLAEQLRGRRVVRRVDLRQPGGDRPRLLDQAEHRPRRAGPERHLEPDLRQGGPVHRARGPQVEGAEGVLVVAELGQPTAYLGQRPAGAPAAAAWSARTSRTCSRSCSGSPARIAGSRSTATAPARSRHSCASSAAVRARSWRPSARQSRGEVGGQAGGPQQGRAPRPAGRSSAAARRQRSTRSSARRCQRRLPRRAKRRSAERP